MASNVVAAVTQLVAKGASAHAYPATPAQLGNATGYQGSAASGLRQHMGRRWGLRASMFGGQWPAYTHAQWAVLMGLAPGEVTAQGQVKALRVHGAVAKKHGVTLQPLAIAAAQGATQAATQAKRNRRARKATAQATAPEPTAPAPEPTAPVAA